MSKIFLVASITFRDCIRNKALYGIFALGLMLFTANIIITGMFSWELGKVAVDVGLSTVLISGLIIIFFVGIMAVSNDLEKKTVYLVLARPLTRAHFVLGKYAGLAGVIIVSSAILGACAALSVKLATFRSPGYIPVNFSWPIFFLGLAFLTLSLLLVLALALLWVVVTTHPFTAVLLSLLSYFIGQNIENVKTIIHGNKLFAQNAALLKITDIASWVFPNLSAFDLKTTAAYGLPVNAGSLMWIALYGLSYIGLCLIIGIIVFQRRELV
ncbi:MAG: hypothetical protein MIO92_01330 [Methanosarcinaceae archaeon]|nr:hypothetical protein [Methanosarcinaceae archaeon]